MTLSARLWYLVRVLAVLVIFIAIAEARRGDGERWGPWWGGDSSSGDDDDNAGGDDDDGNGSGGSGDSFGGFNPGDGSGGSGSGGNGNGSGSNGQNSAFLGFDVDQANRYRIIHGILACVSFVAMFPIGAVFVRTLPGRAAMIMHAIAQIVALLLFVAAAALGIWLLVNAKPFGTSLLDYPDHRAHPILGIFILALIFAMPVLGFLHHAKYKKYQRRTVVSHVHIWLGRFLVILGIVNGGLGLKQSGASHDIKVGYAIVAAVAGAIWLFFSVFGEVRRRKEQRQREEEAARMAAVSAGGVAPMMMHRADSMRSSRISTFHPDASTDAGTRRVSVESDPRVQRNKSIRHDSVSEMTVRN